MKRLVTRLLVGTVAVCSVGAVAAALAGSQVQDPTAKLVVPEYRALANGLLDNGVRAFQDAKILTDRSRYRANVKNDDGTYNIPYDYTFASDFLTNGGWSIIDGNGGNNFEWESTTYGVNDNNADNDWLVSPGFQLQGGRMYEIKTNLRIYGSSDSASVHSLLMAGKGNTADQLTDTVTDWFGRDTSGTPVVTNYFTPATDGVYYFGFHHIYDREHLCYIGFHVDMAPLPTAPSVGSNLDSHFDRDFLTGTITFDAPTKFFNGETGTGDVNWFLLRNNVEIASGTTTFGAIGITYNETVPNNGAFNYAVYFRNADGKSEQITHTSRYLGWTYPDQPQVAAAFNDDETAINLTWNPVTRNSNTNQNGFCDYDSITYNVKRVETGEVLAEGLTAPGFTDNIGTSDGTFENYRYEVSAWYHNTGANSTSSKTSTLLARGCKTMPFSATISSDVNSYAGWKTFNPLNGPVWSFSGNGAQLYTTNGRNLDSWLATPKIKVKPGKKVQLHFEYRSNYANRNLSMEWYLGNDNTGAECFTQRMDSLEVKNNALQAVDTVIVAPSNGIITLGWRAPAGQQTYSYLYVQNVKAVYIPDVVSSNPDDINIPYVEEWPTKEAFDKWVNIGNTFTWQTNNNGRVYSGQLWNNKGEAWLISPAVWLAAGTPYQAGFNFGGWPGAGYEEGFGISIGRDTTVEAMTQVIMPTRACKYDEPGDVLGNVFTVPEDGYYHFGFHLDDPEGKHYSWQSYIYNFFVNYMPVEKAYDAPTDVTFETNGWDGVLKFTAPTKTLDGQDAQGTIKSINVKRNGAGFMTYHNVAPGQTFTINEHATTPVEYTYTISAFNGEDDGTAATVSGYLGLGLPKTVTGLKVYEKPDVPGKVFVEWDAVTEDVNGVPAHEGDITYNIVNNRGQSISGQIGLTECNTTLDVDSTAGSVIQLGVLAISAKGNAESYPLCDLMSVGKTYDHFVESFPNATITTCLGSGNPNFAVQAIASGRFAGYNAVDDDGGFLVCQRQAIDDGSIQFGKILVDPELEKPVFSFYANNVKLDNANICGVQVNAGNGWTTLKDNIVMDGTLSGTDGGWGKVFVDMSAYKGQTVVIRVTFGIRKYVNIFFDNFRMENGNDYDLVAGNITLPSKPVLNKNFQVSFSVSNQGLKSVKSSNYKVIVTRNGKTVGGMGGTTLKSGAAGSFTVTDRLSILETGTQNYVAEVIFKNDEKQENNISDTVAFEVPEPKLPGVTLEAMPCDEVGVVHLSWKAPVVDDGPMDYIESFEEPDEYSTTIDYWKFLDLDGLPVGGFNGITIPGWGAGSDKSSWMVWGPTILNQLGVTPAEGTKVLATMFQTVADARNNDWLISPKLTGEAQTVSFKAYANPSDPEYMRVLYSTTDDQPESFVCALDTTLVPAKTWTEYSVALPEGAQYFAIQHCSKYAFWMLVDDIHFRCLNPLSGLNVASYNVYRNGSRLANVKNETRYSDEESCGLASYNIGVMYDKVEGKASNTVTIGTFPAVTITGRVEDSKVVLEWQAPKFVNGNEMPVVGYNVFCDGQLINGTPITATTYSDANMALDQSHTYAVQTLYQGGQSPMSNEFTTTVSGIGDAITVTTATEVARYDELGRQVTPDAQGWVLIRYDNGTTVKKLVK